MSAPSTCEASLAFAYGHAQGARRWLERAIQIRPEPILYNTLYAIRLKLDDFTSAIHSLRQGLAFQPDFVAFHYNLALTLQHLDHSRRRRGQLSSNARTRSGPFGGA